MAKKDEIEPWLRRWYDSKYQSWARKVDAADPGYKAAAERIERALDGKKAKARDLKD